MKRYILTLAVSAALISCNNESKEDPFIISKEKVGALTKETQIRELDSIFAEDSVVMPTRQNRYDTNNIFVYSKSGDELLKIDPVQAYDSTSTIANIRIKDNRYKTKKGLHSQSTFKDIAENYKISRIENTVNTAVIFLDEINAYVTISKEDISGDATFDSSAKIEPTQIPDNAKIKNFWMGWK